jgi:tetratricopeptide (TPR) repeat protein
MGSRDLVLEARNAFSAKDFDGGRALLVRAHKLARSDERRTMIAELWRTQAQALAGEAEWAESLAFYEAGIPLHGADSEALADMINNHGYALHMVGRYDDAERACRHALELHQAAERRMGAAGALASLAEIAYARGVIADAEARSREAVAIVRELDNNKVALAYHLYSLGRILAERGKTNESEALGREGAELARTMNLVAVHGNYQNMLANFALMDARIEEAQQLYEQALAHFQRHKMVDAEATTTATLGDLMWNRGLVDEAIELYERALKIPRKANHDWARAILLTARGDARTELGRFDDAKLDLDEAIALTVKIAHGRREGFVRCAFARLAEARGEREEARAHYAEAEMALEAATDTVRLGRMLCALAGLQAELRDIAGAEALLARAVVVDPVDVQAEKIGDRITMALRALADARIAVARAAESRPADASVLRARAATALAMVTDDDDPLVDRNSEVRRVSGRLEAALRA